jgi:alpha-mannosidase
VLRYIIPRDGTAIGLNVRVLWQEKDRMLKLRIATPMKNATYLGQVACGVQSLPTNGDEAVAQRWVAVVDDEADTALTCVNNGTYASDFARGELRLTLLRSGAYAAHPIGKRPLLPEDRYMPRFEQGERTFSFELHAGAVREQLESVDRHAAVFNERPMALSLFPTAEGRKPGAGPQLSDSVTQLSAMKLAEDRKGVIVRLFNPTDRRRRTTLRVPMLNVKHAVSLGPFELRTLRIDPKSRHLTDNDLVEGPIRD